MTDLALDWRVIGPVLFGLTMFGIAFNLVVGWMKEHKEGYTALLVALGVLVTLAGAALINWQGALITLLCFMASGVPMIGGDIYRHVSTRAKAIKSIQDESHE